MWDRGAIGNGDRVEWYSPEWSISQLADQSVYTTVGEAFLISSVGQRRIYSLIGSVIGQDKF